jgi:hypothetical protein
MLPSDAIIKGSLRWIRLLRTSSTLSQAWLIVRTDSRYTDLTQSQYATALELLKNIGIFEEYSGSSILAEQWQLLPVRQMSQLLFEKIIEYDAPAWLPDADILIPDPSELPDDALRLAHALNLHEHQSFGAVRNLQRRVDLAKRKLIGDAGELALLRCLEDNFPGSTIHVASLGDGYGYDIAFEHNQREWHLEVKSTTRRGRMTIYLSRHEYEVSCYDPAWLLIVVGLDSNLQLKAVGTIRAGYLASLAPVDVGMEARWQSVAYDVSGKHLTQGIYLPEGDHYKVVLPNHLVAPPQDQQAWFAWMPQD